ncbi:SAM-dependent methyltransferase [Planctomyces sp. SH-PL14]|uniref:SAM-dependent methyltransferase n=1 Tax=Planctomyces sp. SH-PL14 TaxID=1632864 RepID=UPI00078CAA65|nr:class I SAM-dependent methyltransferase [Planctomyces sp. SH-PL14]AMV22355.1 Demethylrebeccamycin-D-glucose O-methyltransferase [Planctomyces sp. SH-PL14]
MSELLWNAPVSAEKMAEVFETLELRPGQSVLDVGCGSGEVLIRLRERSPLRGLGIDLSAERIREARQRADGRVDAGEVRFLEADARTLEIDPASVDLALCLGSTHAFELGDGAYAAALRRLRRWVIPGGLLLVGEPYLERPAAPEYRAILGAFPPDDRTHASNIAIARDMGLIPLAAWTANLDEWDHFEWGHQRTIERLAAKGPPTPETTALLERRRRWMDAYLQWGRRTLGYGTYLFRQPSE